MPEPPPRRIGRYDIVEEIGRGTMGVVYKAEDPLLGRLVALKTINLVFSASQKERKAYEQRFLAEARAAARLSHPGIVVVFDIGMEAADQRPFMALEYLVGQSLEKRIGSGRPLEWREALRIAGQVAEALHHAHAQGIVHRDIKPANIMILDSGDPKIMDFGIAKLPASHLTTSGQFFGSPAYMSPEAARGEPLDSRSDLFSLGTVLYEMLTGRRAFPGREMAAILMQVAFDDPPPPSEVLRGAPKELDEVVARSLAKLAADRYPDGREFAEDVQDLLEACRPRHLQGWTKSVQERATVPVETAPDEGGLAAAATPPPSVAPEGVKTSPPGRGAALVLPPGKRVAVAFLTGPRQGEVFLLERPRLVIGRAGGRCGADLEIDDPEISRVHAAVECYESRIVLRDLESRNGTYVGDERIQEQELENRAEFSLGRTGLMLILSDAD